MDDQLPIDQEAAVAAGGPDLNVLKLAPGLVRVVIGSGWRIANWALTTTIDTGTQVLRSVVRGEAPTDAIADVVTTLREVGRQALGLGPLREPEPGISVHQPPPGRSAAELRALGAELLTRSADVWAVEEIHPAYERILGEMAPDEARILRFLAVNGPQPAVDIRTNRPLGVGSELVASGLSMIGLHAGVRQIERTSAYQNNLFRLGLIWFSREELDPGRYQVVEVQPEVADAMKRAGRAPKTVRRSIVLTPFGEDFCQTCLPLNGHGPPPLLNGRGPGTNGSTSR